MYCVLSNTHEHYNPFFLTGTRKESKESKEPSSDELAPSGNGWHDEEGGSEDAVKMESPRRD